jgi:hypothetical protein
MMLIYLRPERIRLCTGHTADIVCVGEMTKMNAEVPADNSQGEKKLRIETDSLHRSFSSSQDREKENEGYNVEKLFSIIGNNCVKYLNRPRSLVAYANKKRNASFTYISNYFDVTH